MTSKSVSEKSNAHPEVLVDTQWLQDHINDKRVGIAQIDDDQSVHISTKIGII